MSTYTWTDTTELEFYVDEISEEVVVAEAVAHFNDYIKRQARKGNIRLGYWFLTPISSPAMTARVRDNYARHVLTNYDDLIAGTPGDQYALRKEVLETEMRAKFEWYRAWYTPVQK